MSILGRGFPIAPHIAPPGIQTIQGVAALAGAGSVGSPLATDIMNDITFGGIGAMSNNNVVQGCTTTLGGIGAISQSLVRQLVTTTLAGLGMMSGAPVTTIFGVAALAGIGALTTLVNNVMHDIAFSGIGAMSSPVVQLAPASFASLGALASLVNMPCTGSLPGIGAMSPDVNMIMNDISMAALGALTALVTDRVIANFAGLGALSNSNVVQPCTSALPGIGALTALVHELVTASLPGVGALTSSYVNAYEATATMAAAGALSALVRELVTSSLNSQGALTSYYAAGGTATLSGAGAVQALVNQINSGVTLPGTGALLAKVLTESFVLLAGSGGMNNPDVIQRCTAVLAGLGTLFSTYAGDATVNMAAFGAIAASATSKMNDIILTGGGAFSSDVRFVMNDIVMPGSTAMISSANARSFAALAAATTLSAIVLELGTASFASSTAFTADVRELVIAAFASSSTMNSIVKQLINSTSLPGLSTLTPPLITAKGFAALPAATTFSPALVRMLGFQNLAGAGAMNAPDNILHVTAALASASLFMAEVTEIMRSINLNATSTFVTPATMQGWSNLAGVSTLPLVKTIQRVSAGLQAQGNLSTYYMQRALVKILFDMFETVNSEELEMLWNVGAPMTHPRSMTEQGWISMVQTGKRLT